MYKDIFGDSSPTFNTELRNIAGSFENQDEFRMVDNYEEAELPSSTEENQLLRKYHLNNVNNAKAEVSLFEKQPTETLNCGAPFQS